MHVHGNIANKLVMCECNVMKLAQQLSNAEHYMAALLALIKVALLLPAVLAVFSGAGMLKSSEQC